MNETLRIQQAHRSIRSYKPDPVSDAMLDQIIAAAHRAPTSMNAQDISLIVVRDAEKRARIAELCGGQAWIAQAPVFIVIAIDYHKTDLGVRKAGQAQIVHESMEGFGVAAVDAGIVPIGSIRRNPQGMIDLLGLPPLTFPLVGLCIGHIKDDVSPKPRMDIKTFRHDERYDASGYAAAIDAYDMEIMDYWKQIERSDGTTWSGNLGNFYKQVYFPQVKPVAAMQGLLNDK